MAVIQSGKHTDHLLEDSSVYADQSENDMVEDSVNQSIGNQYASVFKENSHSFHYNHVRTSTPCRKRPLKRNQCRSYSLKRSHHLENNGLRTEYEHAKEEYRPSSNETVSSENHPYLYMAFFF